MKITQAELRELRKLQRKMKEEQEGPLVEGQEWHFYYVIRDIERNWEEGNGLVKAPNKQEAARRARETITKEEYGQDWMLSNLFLERIEEGEFSSEKENLSPGETAAFNRGKAIIYDSGT